MKTEKRILLANNIQKNYYLNNATVDVLKGIDLEIYEGEIVAVTGYSGVGKSTLLHILGVLDRPTKGRLFIDDKDVFKYDNRKLANYRNQMS